MELKQFQEQYSNNNPPPFSLGEKDEDRVVRAKGTKPSQYHPPFTFPRGKWWEWEVQEQKILTYHSESQNYWEMLENPHWL